MNFKQLWPLKDMNKINLQNLQFLMPNNFRKCPLKQEQFKGELQSDLRMCTKEPTFYDTNSLTMFWVLEKPDYCFYTLEA
jgi:hypothetical protein